MDAGNAVVADDACVGAPERGPASAEKREPNPVALLLAWSEENRGRYALSVLLAAWVLPPVMGWNVTGDAADLSALRTTSAIILFAMGVFVLARVARPLNGWRGVLVAVFAAAGVIGAFVPFVANFFALILPTGATMVATLIALAGSALIFALCLWLAPLVRGLTGKLSRRH